MTRITCPECGQIIESAGSGQPSPGNLQCPSCNTSFKRDEGTELGNETAVLQRATDRKVVRSIWIKSSVSFGADWNLTRKTFSGGVNFLA